MGEDAFPEPPHNIAAEQAVLGAMMLSRDAIADVLEVIGPGEHYRPAHQLVHEAILRLYERDEPADPIAVANELTRGGEIAQVGGGPYLHTLSSAVPAAANAGYYARIVHELAERRKLIEHANRLRELAGNPAVDMDSVRELAATVPAVAPGAHRPRGRQLVLTPASEIEPEPVVWAWEEDGFGRIPAGSLGLAAGREGTGKSSFLIWMAARITTGTLPGSFDSRPRGVIYVAVEDSWKYTIVPRLMAAGADLKLVYRAEVQALEGETVSLSLPADNRVLEEAITSNDIALVALDPLMSAISDTLDTHVNRQVRQALDPLARIADRTGAVFAGIAHFNKSSSTDASSLITASGAFKDVARFIFAFATDPEDGVQVISQTKNSLGHSDLPSLAYRIIEATVSTAKGDAKVGRFVLDGPSERTVQDILSVQSGSGGDRAEKTRAEDHLKEALDKGPRPAKEVEEEAREVHGISKRTLDRARKTLRIATAKSGSRWWIALPEHEGDLANLPAETAKDAKDANGGTVGNHAKDANAASPGVVGTVGTVESANGTGKVVALWPQGSIGHDAQ